MSSLLKAGKTSRARMLTTYRFNQHLIVRNHQARSSGRSRRIHAFYGPLSDLRSNPSDGARSKADRCRKSITPNQFIDARLREASDCLNLLETQETRVLPNVRNPFIIGWLLRRGRFLWHMLLLCHRLRSKWPSTLHRLSLG
jgi:hypothetical protein